MLIIVGVLSSVFLFIYYLIDKRYGQFSRQGIPGPKPTFPFGNTKSSILRKRNVVYDVDDIYQ